MNGKICNTFHDYFELVPAVTEALKREVYKLRYQVYCMETGFLNPADHPEGLEFDEYDKNASHCLIRHRRTGAFAATTRLIVIDPAEQGKLFPMELHSRIEDFEVIKRIPRDKLAEISRFCISKEFKRRKLEDGTLTGVEAVNERIVTENERRSFPYLTLALIASLIKMSQERDIYYVFAVMDSALLRFLSSLGIDFIGIGPLVEYYGKQRKPTVIKVSQLLQDLAEKNPELHRMFTCELDSKGWW